MKYIQITLLLTVLLGFNACSSLQYNDEVRPSKPGACYAKCQVPASMDAQEIPYFRYTGDNPNQKGVALENFIIEKGGTEWEKKKTDHNCLSKDPEDCIVWCLIEKPDKTISIVKVVDTSLVKDYVLDFVDVEYASDLEDYTEWREIVCKKDVTKSLITKVQGALISKGYEISNGVTGKMNRETKAALVKFQEDYNYATGALSIESMNALGVY